MQRIEELLGTVDGHIVTMAADQRIRALKNRQSLTSLQTQIADIQRQMTTI